MMKKKNILLLTTLALFTFSVPLVHAQRVIWSPSDIAALTPKWQGKRLPDGRPAVSFEFLEKLKQVSVEDVWDFLRAHGYKRQYVNFPGPLQNSWNILHPDQVMTGRVVTAQFMPYRPDLEAYVQKEGKKEGIPRRVTNSAAINILQKGDVYVADSYGKMAGGTLIGANLANAIWTNSHRGFIFNGAIRDLDVMIHIKGLNGWYRGQHASAIRKMIMTTLNGPIRIGPVTVLPGDVVLANRAGVIFIPPYLVPELVAHGEFIRLLNNYRQLRVRQGKYNYKNEHIVGGWNLDMVKDLKNWILNEQTEITINKKQLEKQLDQFKKGRLNK